MRGTMVFSGQGTGLGLRHGLSAIRWGHSLDLRPNDPDKSIVGSSILDYDDRSMSYRGDRDCSYGHKGHMMKNRPSTGADTQPVHIERFASTAQSEFEPAHDYGALG